MRATRSRNLEQLYSGPKVLEVPLYSVFEAARYLQIPENTLRSWVAGRTYPLRSGASRRSEPVIELTDPANSRLSFSNLTEAHVLDALRRQYRVELPQIRRAVNYLREHFQSSHLWSITRCSPTASTCSLKPRDSVMSSMHPDRASSRCAI